MSCVLLEFPVLQRTDESPTERKPTLSLKKISVAIWWIKIKYNANIRTFERNFE